MSDQFPGTGLFDPPPEEPGDPEYNLAYKAKQKGVTRRAYVQMRSDAIRLTGKTLKWDSETYDKAFAALSMIAEEVWGQIQ